MVGETAQDRRWGTLFWCSERVKLPDFELLFGDYWMRVRQEDYVVELDEEGQVCGMCFSATDSGYWLLGDAFMRGWYNIHDHENSRMGFVPFAGSSKPPAELAASKPTAVPDWLAEKLGAW